MKDELIEFPTKKQTKKTPQKPTELEGRSLHTHVQVSWGDMNDT